MVPTKQLWLLLDVIISLAGSQTSEHGSVSQTNKPQGLLSTHGKWLLWVGSGLCFVILGQAFPCLMWVSQEQIWDLSLHLCSTTGSSKIGLLTICLQPIPRDKSACATDCSDPLIPAVPAERCRHPCAGPRPAGTPAASSAAAATSAEQTTGVFTQLLGWVLHPAEFCTLSAMLLLRPELPGFKHAEVYLLFVAMMVATAVRQSLQPFQRAHFLVMLLQYICWYP